MLVVLRLRDWRRWSLAVALIVLLIGFSRLYLGVHYPLAGYFVAARGSAL